MKRNQSGSSLVEVLVTLVVIGASFAALLGGLGMSIAGSALHRTQANAEPSIRSTANIIQAATYVNCTGPFTSYTSGAPAGVTIVVTPLKRDGSSFSGCTAITDEGLQKVTITFTGAGIQDSASIIKRNV